MKQLLRELLCRHEYRIKQNVLGVYQKGERERLIFPLKFFAECPKCGKEKTIMDMDFYKEKNNGNNN